jgi:hypothetical protein
VSKVANRRGSVDWFAGLLGGGSAAVTSWDAADGRGAAAGNPITVDDEQWFEQWIVNSRFL